MAHLLSLADLTLAAPLWLAGLAALGAPLIAHLWSRRAGPPAPFPSIRLIRAIYADRPRRARWRDWLLLAMRCAIIAMAVAAFARPVWTDPAMPAPPPEHAGEGLTIVLDASASMRRTYRGTTLFDRARRRAAELARHDPRPVRIILAAERHRPLLPEPTTHVDALLDALDAAEPSFHHGRLDEAELSHGAHVITDGQRAAWSVHPGEFDVPLRLHVVGDPADADNTAVENVRLQPSQPTIGETAMLSFDLVNHAEAARSVAVSIDAGGRTDVRQCNLTAGQRLAVSAPLRFARAGAQVVSIALPPDTFALDDRVSLVATVHPPPGVALRTDGQTHDPGDAAFYLARALPIGEAPGEGDLIVAHHLVSPAEDEIDRLTGRIAGGTGLVYFAGPDDAATLERLGDLMPIEVVRPARDDPPVAFRPIDAQRPPWRAFEGDALTTLLEARFASRLVCRTRADGRALAFWPAGSPAVAIGKHGRGRVVVFTGDIDPSHSSFIRSPAFLPLVREMIRLAGETVEPIHLTRPATEVDIVLSQATQSANLRVLAPSGAAVPFVARREPNRTRITIGTAERIGLYRALGEGDRLLGGLTVTLDPRESDLRPLAEPLPTAGVETHSDPTASPAQPLGRIEVWPYLALATLVLAIAESLLANLTAVKPASSTRADPWMDPETDHT